MSRNSERINLHRQLARALTRYKRRVHDAQARAERELQRTWDRLSANYSARASVEMSLHRMSAAENLYWEERAAERQPQVTFTHSDQLKQLNEANRRLWQPKEDVNDR